MLDKILLPLDGSELAERSLLYIQELATVFRCEIRLIFVNNLRHASEKHLHEVYLNKIAKQLTVQLKVSGSQSIVNIDIVDGEPAHELISYADNNGVDLVIITSHGFTGIMPWTLGSVASKLIQHADFPVLLARSDSPYTENLTSHNFDSILVPLDGSPLSETVLPYVKEITRVIKCQVILMRVVEPIQRVQSIGGLDHFVFTEQQIEEMKLEAHQYLVKQAGEFSGTKADICRELRVGNAPLEIIKFSSDSKVRLIAMSSHGKSGIKKWVLGSVSDKVVHAGKTSILLIKHKMQDGRSF